jgi:hypothetical protein
VGSQQCVCFIMEESNLASRSFFFYLRSVVRYWWRNRLLRSLKQYHFGFLFIIFCHWVGRFYYSQLVFNKINLIAREGSYFLCRHPSPVCN